MGGLGGSPADGGHSVRLLCEDPALGAGVAAQELPAATRAAVADVSRLDRGPWQPSADPGPPRGRFGLFVLSGMLLRRVTVHGAPCAELLGSGDLLRPGSLSVEQVASVAVQSAFFTLAPARLAVLDRAFAQRIARWPEVTEALLERVTDRNRRLAYSLAIQRSKRVDERLWLQLWQIADRWGTVRPEGVEVHLPGLSHRVLGSLIAASRPSVTTALGTLMDRGLLRRLPRDGLMLCGEPSLDAVRDRTTPAGANLLVGPDRSRDRHTSEASVAAQAEAHSMGSRRTLPARRR